MAQSVSAIRTEEKLDSDSEDPSSQVSWQFSISIYRKDLSNQTIQVLKAKK